MATLHIPTPLRPYTEGQKEIELNGDDIAALLELLVEQYPDVRQYIYNKRGQLRPYVNLFLNGEDVRNLEGENTLVGEDDKVRIVPSIAGGRAHRSMKSWEMVHYPFWVLTFRFQLPILRQLKMSNRIRNRATFNSYFYYGTQELVAEGVV